MPAGITNNLDRVVTRTIFGVTFATVALEEAIDDTLKKGEEIALHNVSHYVYLAFPEGAYERTYTLLDSVKASKFFATGGQVYLSRQQFRKRYYPRYVDEGTKSMEARNFWAPTREALKMIVEANMAIAATRTAQMLAGEKVE